MSKEIKTISDLTPDNKNANKGTQRGGGLLENSLQSYGAGRSVLADKNGNLIAGNKTVESAVSVGMNDVIVVQSDGTKLVVVQRTDLDINSKEARGLAISDNRVAELNLDWDTDVLTQLAADGMDLSDLFTGDEFSALAAEPNDEEWSDALGALPDGEKAPFQQMTFTVSDSQAGIVSAALSKAKAAGGFDTDNENSNGNALARICESYGNR